MTGDHRTAGFQRIKRDVELGLHASHRELAKLTPGRQHRFALDFLVLKVMATTTRRLTLISRGGFELQKFR
jgi:hypothetical protein